VASLPNPGDEELVAIVLKIGQREEIVEIRRASSSVPVAAAVAPSASVPAVPVPREWDSMSAVAKISFLQKADGHWEPSSLLEQAFSAKPGTLSAALASNGIDGAQWATSVTIGFLETKLASHTSEW
jgi:hypothetical protein